MWHSEINNLPDKPMRFIQMWFFPSKHGLEPSVEQKRVEISERTDRFLPLVSNTHPGALRIVSDAAVYSCFLEAGKKVDFPLKEGCGAYLYVLEGGPVDVNSKSVPALGAAMVQEERELRVGAGKDAELLQVEVLLV
jgi:redox-sensitive bicupin YhaK (pirin superfamily)